MTPLQAAIERAHSPGFGHADHIRLGWHLLRDSRSELEAMTRVRDTLRAASVRHHGDVGKYHETITLAFMRLIGTARSALPSTHSFAEFCLMYPELLRKDALDAYYSQELLLSARARMGWVEPDLRGLPPRSD